MATYYSYKLIKIKKKKKKLLHSLSSSLKFFFSLFSIFFSSPHFHISLFILTFFFFLGKLRIWSLFYTPYFNLVPNFSIVSIWSLTFQYHVNLVLTIIFWMKIDNASNGQNKKLAFVDMTIHYNFILTI